MDFCQLVAHSLWTHTSTVVLRQGVPCVHFLRYGKPPCSPYFETGFYNKGSLSDDSEQVLLISFPCHLQRFCRPFFVLRDIVSFPAWEYLAPPFLPRPCPPRTCTHASPSCGSTASLNQAGTSTCALGCRLARSCRCSVAHDGEGSRSQADPSRDKVLTDWTQCHRMWAGLTDRVRRKAGKQVWCASRVLLGAVRDKGQRQIHLQHMSSKNWKPIKGF